MEKTMKYIREEEKVVFHLLRFAGFVKHQDRLMGIKKDDSISFRDSNGFLGIEEDYKSRVAEEARAALQYEKWEENWIGSGKIAKCASQAMNAAGNLVFINQQFGFKRKLNPENKEYKPNAERVLYDIYRGDNDREAFEHAIEIFGAKYDVIAFLFFVKDDTRFLPISPENFDLSFKELGIDYSTSRKCSWDNYTGYISIIREIQEIMDDVLPLPGRSRLIDAHSFIWIINEKKYRDWESPVGERTIEIKTQKTIEGKGGNRKQLTTVYNRSAKVVKEVRERADGICQLCGLPAPFNDKKGIPYLEVHHVIWLSKGGKDSTDNAVALCPNCHVKMHELNNEADLNKLLSIAKSYTNEE